MKAAPRKKKCGLIRYKLFGPATTKKAIVTSIIVNRASTYILGIEGFLGFVETL